jgi:hypothetical protein
VCLVALQNSVDQAWAKVSAAVDERQRLMEEHARTVSALRAQCDELVARTKLQLSASASTVTQWHSQAQSEVNELKLKVQARDAQIEALSGRVPLSFFV